MHRVFPFSSGQTDEVMVNGTSKYEFEDGTKGTMQWAARLHFIWSNGEPLIDLYHIFPVSALFKIVVIVILTVYRLLRLDSER